MQVLKSIYNLVSRVRALQFEIISFQFSIFFDLFPGYFRPYTAYLIILQRRISAMENGIYLAKFFIQESVLQESSTAC